MTELQQQAKEVLVLLEVSAEDIDRVFDYKSGNVSPRFFIRKVEPILRRIVREEPNTEIQTLNQQVKAEIDTWPDWKKKAYNDNFAIGIHTTKFEAAE